MTIPKRSPRVCLHKLRSPLPVAHGRTDQHRTNGSSLAVTVDSGRFGHTIQEGVYRGRGAWRKSTGKDVAEFG